MNLKLSKKSKIVSKEIIISGSKSESNRLLILQKLYNNLTIENLSDCDDTQILKKILDNPGTDDANVHHAGTAMRFLTAYFASQEGKTTILSGSERMLQRPIKHLVDALQNLGAQITYLAKEGFPPLKIIGKKNLKSEVSIKGNVSSQYISALILIAPRLEKGLIINIIGKVTSLPYLKMTLNLLEQIGVKTTFNSNKITISPAKTITTKTITIESDWSSASYWYSCVVLGKVNSEITLASYHKNSLQGDSDLIKIYEQFGVETTFSEQKITLKKITEPQISNIEINLIKTPDIAQTIAVTCLGLGLQCKLTGLHTLKVKETDRLIALKNEITKFGANVVITEDSFYLDSFLIDEKEYKTPITIKTYNDHRMAMCFAPLALKIPLTILNAEVVTKSYPEFWKDFDNNIT